MRVIFDLVLYFSFYFNKSGEKLFIMDSTAAIIVLVVIGIILLFIEMVIPGAIIGLIGLACIVIGLIMAFDQSASFGLVLSLISFAVGMLFFHLWIKYFPKTSIGKKIFLDKNARDWQGYDKDNLALIGLAGLAHTDLRPSGIAIINNNRFDVVTQGEMIERGQQIKVHSVEGNRIVVTRLKSVNG